MKTKFTLLFACSVFLKGFQDLKQDLEDMSHDDPQEVKEVHYGPCKHALLRSLSFLERGGVHGHTRPIKILRRQSLLVIGSENKFQEE